MNKRAKELFEQANYDIMLEERKLEMINEFNQYHTALVTSTVEQLFEWSTGVKVGTKVVQWGSKAWDKVKQAGKWLGIGGGGGVVGGLFGGGTTIAGNPGSVASPLEKDMEKRNQNAKQLADKNAQSAKDALAKKEAIKRPSGQETIGIDTERDRGEKAASVINSIQRAQAIRDRANPDTRNISLEKARNLRANARERGIITSHYVAHVAKDVVKLLETQFDIPYDKQIIEQVIYIINENIDEEYVNHILSLNFKD